MPQPEYPWVGESTKSGTQVLFTAYKMGQVVKDGYTRQYRVGYFSDDWVMGNFVQVQTLREYMEKQQHTETCSP